MYLGTKVKPRSLLLIARKDKYVLRMKQKQPNVFTDFSKNLAKILSMAHKIGIPHTIK
jgi:hypothetical protein